MFLLSVLLLPSPCHCCHLHVTACHVTSNACADAAACTSPCRSTFPGHGQYGFHWTGDNGANWANLYWSIAGIINSNFWGMDMVGADICGFNDETTTDDNGNEQFKLSDNEYRRLCLR
jgi:hypothetical protein